MFDYKSDLKEALRAFNNKTKLDGWSTYSPLLAVCRREGWRFVPWRVDGVPVRSDDTPRIDVDSDEFKKWFDDSVMVGADGRPLSFWHGTFKDFELFDDSPATRLPHR